MIHQLLQQDTDTESRQDRNEKVLLHYPADNHPVGQPADQVQHHECHRDANKRGDAPTEEQIGDEATEHDVLALADVDDIHHTPYQCHAVGHQGENRSNQQAVYEQLHRKNRRVKQDLQVVHEKKARQRRSRRWGLDALLD